MLGALDMLVSTVSESEPTVEATSATAESETPPEAVEPAPAPEVAVESAPVPEAAPVPATE